MRERRRMPVREHIAIRIKNAQPGRWWAYGLVCLALLGLLLGMGFRSGQTEGAEAPEALSDPDNQVRVTVLGELDVTEAIRAQAAQIGYGGLLRNLEGYWAESDYVLATAAGPVRTEAPSPARSAGAGTWLPSAALPGLARAGITGLNFATDGAYSSGGAGVARTASAMEQAGLAWFGLAPSEAEPSYLRLPFGGAEQPRTVAVLGVNAVPPGQEAAREGDPDGAGRSMAACYRQVNEAARAADVTLVCLHSGESGQDTVTDRQRSVAHALIDSGADVVVGTHSHRVQSMECYNGGLILYGIGDVFSTSDYSFLLHAAMLDLVVTGEGERFAYVTPLHMDNGLPRVARQPYYCLSILKALTAELSEDAYVLTGDGQIRVSLGKLPEAR